MLLNPDPARHGRITQFPALTKNENSDLEEWESPCLVRTHRGPVYLVGRRGAVTSTAGAARAPPVPSSGQLEEPLPPAAQLVDHVHQRHHVLEGRVGEQAVPQVEDVPRPPGRPDSESSARARGCKPGPAYRTTGSRLPWTPTE